MALSSLEKSHFVRKNNDDFLTLFMVMQLIFSVTVIESSTAESMFFFVCHNLNFAALFTISYLGKAKTTFSVVSLSIKAG